MYLQAQRVFSVSADRHYRLLHAANEEKPKIIVLTVIVQEAEGLEAKDANGKLALVLLIHTTTIHRASGSVSLFLPSWNAGKNSFRIKNKLKQHRLEMKANSTTAAWESQ